MKKRKRILSALLALLMCASCAFMSLSPAARAITQADIDELQAQSDELNSRISEIEEKLEELSRQEFKTIAQKELYDEQITLLCEQIETTKATIKEYDRLIEIAEENLRLALDASTCSTISCVPASALWRSAGLSPTSRSCSEHAASRTSWDVWTS